MKGIVSKLMEARHSKSMDSYELLAQFCSKESITKLILPLKEVRRGLNLETEDNQSQWRIIFPSGQQDFFVCFLSVLRLP